MRGVKSRIVSGLLLLAMLASVYVYARWVFFAPTRTPLLILSSNYLPPWDINPWEKENVAAIEALGQHNLTTKRLKNVEMLAKGQWSEFDECIAQLKHSATPNQPLLLYVNLHGVVGPNDQPYLLARNSVPLDSSTWVPLQSILDHISKVLQRDRAVVLFMECGRQYEVLPDNSSNVSFAASVRRIFEQFAAESQFKDLCLYLSTSTAISSTDTPDGLADPFTMFISQGLAGNCDLPRMGGNGNRHVEAEELLQFIARKTREFAISRRGFYQTPVGYSTIDKSLSLAWAGNVVSEATTTRSYSSKHSYIADVEEIWRSIGTLRERSLWKRNPSLWANLVEHAIALEDSAFSSEFGGENFIELKKRSHALLQVAGQTEMPLASEKSIGQNANFDLRLLQRSLSYWNEIATTPSWNSLQEKFREANRSALPHEIPPPFLVHMQKSQANIFWRNPELTRQFSKAMAMLERSRLILAELPFLKSIGQLESTTDQIRRRCEDRFVANQINSDLLTDLQVFSQRSESLFNECTAISQCISEIENALSKLPCIFRAMDSLDALESESNIRPFATRVSEIVRTIGDNLLAIEDRMLDRSDVLKSRPFRTIRHEFSQLHTEMTSHWQDLIRRKSTLSPAEEFALQEILRSGFFPENGLTVDDAISLRIESRKQLSLSAMRAETRQVNQPSDPIDIPMSNRLEVAKLISLLAAKLDIASQAISQTKEGVDLEQLSSFVCDTTKSNPDNDVYKDLIRSLIVRTFAPLSMDDQYARVIQEDNIQNRVRKIVESSYRVMEDFWTLPDDGVITNADPYFFRIASILLNQASELRSIELDPSINAAKRRLAVKRQACIAPLTLRAEQLPNWIPNSPKQTRCDIQPEPNGSGLSEGLATVKLTTHGHQPEKVSQAIFEIGPQMSARSITVSLPPTHNNSSRSLNRCTAQITFRGHQLSYDFDLIPDNKFVSVSRLEYDQPATIQVIDPRAKRRSRVLILDCSASMLEPHPQESVADVDSPSPKLSKLSSAKIAISRLLDRWRNSQENIGIVFFGHRVAQGTAEQGSLQQNRYVSQYPVSKTLAAFEDVESVLPVGRFSDSEYSLVSQRLDLLLPWGQTPLFLAIYQTIMESRMNSGELPDDIIVVSDGKNYQFNPTHEKNISLEQLIRVARDAGVRIHIVGFGIPNNELAEATSQYRKLADETQGSVAIDVADSMALMESIDRISCSDNFSVQLATGQTQVGRCSETLRLPESLHPNAPVWVQYRGQRQVVPANSGASMQLIPDENDRLVSARFQEIREIRRIPILNVDQEPSVFRLGVHEPVSMDQGMRWALSLLREDGQVSQRPKRVHIELTPIEDAPAKPTNSQVQQGYKYHVFNDSWRSNTPIPVLEFDTLNWPNSAQKAKLEFWCTDRTVSHVAQISVAKAHAANLGTNEGRRIRMDGLGIEYSVGWESTHVLVLTILEEHGTKSTVIVPQLVGARPIQIDRQYDTFNNTSIHRFQFSEPNMSQLTIQFESAEEVKRIALHVETEIELNMASEIATHKPSAPPVLRR